MKEFEGIISNVLEGIKESVKSGEMLSTPIELDNGKIVIPMHKISIALISGEGGARENSKGPIVGAGVGGISITPMGYMLVNSDKEDDVKIEKYNEDGKWKEFIQATVNLLKKK